MQSTADNMDDPGVLAMLEGQRAMNELAHRWAITPPVVEFARTADGAGVAAVIGDDADEDPLVWVARPVGPPFDPDPVALSSVGPVVRVEPRRFASVLDWRDSVPTVEP